MRNILQQQIIDGQRGIKLSAKVDIERLDAQERKELKSAILAVRKSSTSYRKGGCNSQASRRHSEQRKQDGGGEHHGRQQGGMKREA